MLPLLNSIDVEPIKDACTALLVYRWNINTAGAPGKTISLIRKIQTGLWLEMNHIEDNQLFCKIRKLNRWHATVCRQFNSV